MDIDAVGHMILCLLICEDAFDNIIVDVRADIGAVIVSALEPAVIGKMGGLFVDVDHLPGRLHKTHGHGHAKGAIGIVGPVSHVAAAGEVATVHPQSTGVGHDH